MHQESKTMMPVCGLCMIGVVFWILRWCFFWMCMLIIGSCILLVLEYWVRVKRRTVSFWLKLWGMIVRYNHNLLAKFHLGRTPFAWFGKPIYPRVRFHALRPPVNVAVKFSNVYNFLLRPIFGTVFFIFVKISFFSFQRYACRWIWSSNKKVITIWSIATQLCGLCSTELERSHYSNACNFFVLNRNFMANISFWSRQIALCI